MSLRDASCQAGARSEAVVVPGGLPRDAVVGVLGGGQLGKMLGTDAARMGVKLKVLDPTPGCPASSVAEQVEGSFRDASAVRAFAAGVDVLTTEIEHVDVGTLEELERSGVDVQPSAATIRVIQDKLLQKRHFEGVGSEVPLAPFCQVRSLEDARRAGKTFGYPFMLKARRLAYDGRGNAVVAAPGGEEAAVAALGGAGETGEALYAEKWVPHAGELGVMVVRSRDGSVTSFPPTQTRQRDSVCLLTETPTRLGAALEARARGVAEKAVSCLEGAGVFGVELFVVPGASGSTSQIFLNEIAPRPHNSGHFTIEACEYSQFEAHLRALLGWPLPTPALRVGAAAMLNVLGRAEGAEGVRQAQETLARALATPGCVGHWYGKRGAARGRKLGHVTVTGVHAAQVAARMRCVDARAAAELWTFGDSGGSGRAEGRAEEAGDSASVRQGLDLASVTAFAATAPRPASSPLVGIVMGSDSDLPTMRAAAIELEALGVPFELTLVSAHRTPERLAAYARSAEARGLRVIVAGAGGAAHLPGMLAAQTPLPVVGVPVVPAGAYLDGMDALLSIAQMPKGVPVATVAVGNAANGGLLAARILGASDPTLLRRVQDRADRSEDEVLGKAQRLEKVGWREY